MPLSGYTVVFDLDGTLVDSAPDLIGALNASLEQENLGGIDLPLLRKLVGHGAKALIERAIEVHQVPAQEELVSRMLNTFMVHYQSHVSDLSAPYPQVEETLKSLQKRGADFAVCTNKPTSLAVSLLQHLQLDHYFKAICGGDFFSERKPHADHILKTIALAGGDARRSVMVGDSITDLEAARASQVGIILVDYGYTDIPALELGADYVVSHFEDIVPIIMEKLNLVA